MQLIKETRVNAGHQQRICQVRKWARLMDGCDQNSSPKTDCDEYFSRLATAWYVFYVSPAVSFARTNRSFSIALISAGSAETGFGELDAWRIVRDSMATS
jgi:hypothetical protein